MKFSGRKRLVTVVAAIGALSLIVYGYTQMRRERAADEEGDAAISAVSRVKRNASGETFLSLDLNTQKLVGLQTAHLAPATLAPEVRGYGRVLDPVPLIGLVSEIASARAAADASRQEHQRLRALFEQGQNTSARALETAAAVAKRDQIALAAAEARLTAAWGSALADQPGLLEFARSLATLKCVLVRLDFPVGESLPGTPKGARLVLPGTGRSIEARFLGRAATTDPQMQGEGFLFEVTNAPAMLTPGLAVTGFLELPGAVLHGVIVPEAGIVRSSERTWVYVQTGDATFVRREITLDHPADRGWFVTNGVAPGDRLVITGAQTLLSEERKTEIKLED